MNLRGVAAVVVCLAISIFIVIKLVGPAKNGVVYNPNRIAEEKPKGLPPPKSGPLPKAFVPMSDFLFKSMVLGETKSHDYFIVNQGSGDLELQMHETTCQCTFADMKPGDLRTVKPGEEIKVTLTWKPESVTQNFSKGADIWTNDPETPVIILRATGEVRNNMMVSPPDEWIADEIVGDAQGTASGMIASGILESFNVVSVDRRGEPLDFKLRPMNPETLGKAGHAACGFHIDITFKPENEMGYFSFPIHIKTDAHDDREPSTVDKNYEFDVVVTGVRRGPIRFAGIDWIEEKMAIRMASFNIDEGKETTVTMFVRNPPAEGLKLVDEQELDPSHLKIELIPENNEGKTARYQLKLTYPPNGPRVDRRTHNPGKIKLKTNHPDAKVIDILVYLAAQ